MAVTTVDPEHLYNFSMPTHWQFVSRVFDSATHNCKELTLFSWVDMWNKHAYVSTADVQCAVILGIFWTVLRYVLTALVFEVSITDIW